MPELAPPSTQAASAPTVQPAAVEDLRAAGGRFSGLLSQLTTLSANRTLLWAVLISLGLHFVLLAAFGQIEFAAIPTVVLREIEALVDQPERFEPLDNFPEQLEIATPSEMISESVFASVGGASSSAMPSSVGGGGGGGSFSSSIVGPQIALSSALPTTGSGGPSLEIMAPEQIRGIELDKVLVSHGTVGGEVASVEGAVDRLTREIALNLEQSNVLVIWLMDASISLVDEREAVADRLKRVYREIDELGSLSAGALLSTVASFGQNSATLVPPTGDGDKIVDAIRSVPIDDSGQENVFSAVIASVDQYKALRSREKRKLMVVIWTDESGDDMARLEEAINICQRLTVPVFAVGPSAMFGREVGTQEYRDPEDGQVYQLPVDRGPDTARPELLKLPYWFNGPQHDNLRAGVGPYALTRLATETGGAYFISESKADGSRFRLADLRRYMPAYTSANEYTKGVKQSKVRQAVLSAVDITHQRDLKGTPTLSFAPTGDNFQQQLREAQESVAYDLLTIERALAPFGNKGMEQEYSQEVSPRWQAWYDLTLGRLLAMQVRCHEFNWACAVMKGKGSDFVDQKSNRWEFVPDEKINFGSVSERAAAEATRLLKRAVENNPGTPWALLAQRELEKPFGFRVEEGYVPPPPAMNTPNANNPPPPGIRVEQPRMIPRKTADQLPKL
ncbi:MAG: VWA domain-containing protein [Pirellulales bacterium]|nr:VWA domain-containing protein [Pirellulales bacterium]